MPEEKGHEYLREHRVTGEILSLDLAHEASQVIIAARAAAVGHTAKTLAMEGPLRAVIIGMTPGATLQGHQAEGPVSIHVLYGSITVGARGQSYTVPRAGLLILDAGLPHSVEASEDAAFLLTLAAVSGASAPAQ